jgi:hypothetical protein
MRGHATPLPGARGNLFEPHIPTQLPELSTKTYETRKKFMIKNQTTRSRRGGKREGSGRAPDYRKRCEIYAIQLCLAISESHARRTLRDWGGDLKRIMGSHVYYKVLQDWDRMDDFARGMFYGVLDTRVQHMLARGIGRR